MSFQLFLDRFRGLCSTISTAPLTCCRRSSDRSPLPMGRLSGKGLAFSITKLDLSSPAVIGVWAAVFFTSRYWDVVWDDPVHLGGKYDWPEGTRYSVVMEDENQIEISFTRTWNSSLNDTGMPLNVDKRFIMLRGYPSFCSYAILEHSEGWPDINIYQGRIVFKLEESLFQYMAISDERQRIMPTPQDREAGLILDYPEAVMLTNPSNPELTGEVDDKYQYSCDDKDNRVHGWICSNPAVGFWMITPSDEFRTGGPIKQDLTSHVGLTTLSMFFSTHYAGVNLTIKLRDGEPWKKVFGPVLIYLNSVSVEEDALTLWEDAKEQMLIENPKLAI
ncbi:hypothetical protein CsSME_00051202 [Camellia sinensis var. sinensis]